jgi:hypothetical protein
MLANAVDFDKDLHLMVDFVGEIRNKKRLTLLSQTRVGLHKNDRRIWAIVLEFFNMLCVITSDTNEFHQD